MSEERTKLISTPCSLSVAALYVETGGAYFDLPGIDPWDETRDARGYAGPFPVVAHPPCQRWSSFYAGQPGNIKKGKRERLGDDQGMFAAALWAVRTFGGVLEHPANSKAWPWYGLVKPPLRGGWVKADEYGGMTCRVEQGRYGHFAAKPTWLYAVSCDLPELEWGVRPKTTEADFPPKAIAKHGLKYCQRAGVLAFKGGGKNSTPRIHTPEPFRDLLLSMASSANAKEQERDGK